MQKSLLKKLFILLAIVSLSQPLHAHAIAYVPTAVVVDVSGPSLQRTSDGVMQRVKSYVLDGLAWTVAKIMLQQVTASVVNWINSGFQGSPAFLTDPGSFFADAADQVTGAFISETGALAELCSPFSIDIRLALALQGPSATNKRYTCTLSTLINNVKKSTVSVDGKVTLNGQTVASGNAKGSINGGATMEGFMEGDFSQGGWPAFISMTTEPQNNIYGAYLQAKSDLERQIANKQNNIRVDLSMGRGFMSWPNCKDVNVDKQGRGLDSYEELGVDTRALQKSKTSQSISTGQDYYSGAEYSLQKKVNPKTGEVKYQDCKTETPGSVIAGSIDKSLGIPQDTLNIAGSLNQIVGALFSQLVSKVLSGGLHASSNIGGTGSASAGIANQLLQEKQASQLTNSKTQLSTALNENYDTNTQYILLRQQAVDALDTSKSGFQAAASCYASKLPIKNPQDISIGKSPDQIHVESQIAAITTEIAKVDLAVAQYQAKLDIANANISNLSTLRTQINSVATTDQLNKASSDYTKAIQANSNGSSTLISLADLTVAQNDLQSAQTKADTFAVDAKKFQTACNAFRPSTPTYNGYGSGAGYI